jgi:hypothetical protein
MASQEFGPWVQNSGFTSGCYMIFVELMETVHHTFWIVLYVIVYIILLSMEFFKSVNLYMKTLFYISDFQQLKRNTFLYK